MNLQITLEGGTMKKDTLGLIQEAMDFMEENLKSEIEISEMSKRAGYSEYHFCQLFHRATGLSVKRPSGITIVSSAKQPEKV